MAKKAMIEREKKREKLVAQYAAKRAALKETANDESLPMEERFKARLKLAKLPRNSSATRGETFSTVTPENGLSPSMVRLSRGGSSGASASGRLTWRVLPSRSTVRSADLPTPITVMR